MPKSTHAIPNTGTLKYYCIIRTHPVSVPCDLGNKLPQTLCLETLEIYPLTVLKPLVLAQLGALRGSREGSLPRLFQFLVAVSVPRLLASVPVGQHSNLQGRPPSSDLSLFCPHIACSLV